MFISIENYMLNKVLIAIGDSPESEKIWMYGLTLAEKLGARVLLLHVLNPLQNGFELVGNPLMGGISPIVSDLAVQQYRRDWQDYEQIGTERLNAYAQQAQNHQIASEIFQIPGDSGRIICETAQTNGVDLIVMGRNQKTVLSELLLGSTSSYVLHHAPCSVTIVQ
jgi:nucleotide-binding universal stress UspA family protein